jgi:hypothetical protein
MNELCHVINKRISACKKGTFQFNYSREKAKIYISSPIANENVILNENLREVLGFKYNLINGKSAGSASGMNLVIFAEHPPAFSSDSWIFLYASFVEISRVGNTNVSLLRVLKGITSNDHIHHYNTKHLQYVPVNTSYLELCQLTLRSELGDPLAITKGLAVITCHFRPIQ